MLGQLGQRPIALDGGKRHLRLESRAVVPARSSVHSLSCSRRSSPLSGRNSTYRLVQISGAGSDRGFGFIADDSGGPDMFLHVSALQSAGIDPDDIRKGERLTFDVESTREGKTKASNVRRPG